MSILLSYAFRPFFLVYCLLALLVLPYWILFWNGILPFTISGIDPVSWHAHEMLFGLTGAAIAGFALTAVATWTQRKPVNGLPLLILVLLWLAGRLIPHIPFHNSFTLGAVFDIGFDLYLLFLMSREIISARSERNYKVLLLLTLFALFNALFYINIILQYPWNRLPLYAGIWTVIMLLNTVGGRIIPAFTGNWLRRQAQARDQEPSKLPPGFDSFDATAVVFTVIYAFLFCLNISNGLTALIALLAASLQTVRVWRWQIHRTFSDPLLWIMHSGFLWISIGLVLLGLADIDLLPTSAGIHALSGGAITVLIIAVASRAALGHTNRPLGAGRLLVSCFYCLHLAAFFRVAASIAPQPLLLHSASLFWFLGFVFFTWVYLPILVLPAAKDP